MKGISFLKKAACVWLFAVALILFAICPAMAAGKIALPEATLVIEEEAFAGLEASKVILPEGILRIESRAFAGSAINTINLPRSLTYIAPNAFQGCSGLTASVWENSYAHTWCQQNSVAFQLNQTSIPPLPATTVTQPQKTSDGRIKLSWSVVTGASGYGVFEKLEGIEALAVTTQGTSVYLSGVSTGTHEYTVRAYDGRGNLFSSGEASATVTVTVAENEFAAPPVLSKVDESSANTVTLSWTGSAGSYIILEIGEDGTETEIQTTTGKTITLSNVAAGSHVYAVRAMYSDGRVSVSGQWHVEVYGATEAVTLNVDTLDLRYGETYELIASLSPNLSSRRYLYSWKSSDTSVAVVSSTGEVTAKREGTATITVSLNIASLTATCVVNVTDFNITEGDYRVSHSVLTGYYGNDSAMVIPDGVTRIENVSYYYCGNITSITIPDSVTSIGEKAFSSCSGLTSITIPDSVTSIGDYAFSGCSSLTSITIPDSVTSIGDYAFQNCKGLTSITIPNSVTSVGNYVFQSCSSLTSITIPDSVTSIGNYAFANCQSLPGIEIPDSVTSIGKYAFQYCKGMPSITIPDSVISIGDYAFQYCDGLTGITLSNSLTGIGNYVFYNCRSLTSIEIPDSVASIGDHAFCSCAGSTSITLSNNLTIIEDYAFYGCSSLTSITIPDSVTSIGNDAFGYCGLTSITIPNGVTSIGNGAFLQCKSLTSVNVSNSVTSIGSSAFSGCEGLTTIAIPDSVTSIGGSAFFQCTGLTGITLSNNLNRLEVSAFAYCSSLPGITIPNGVSSIGDSAFRGCKNLTSITIPDSVTSIGSIAFYECAELTSITIPNSVVSIGSFAFAYCENLTSIIIPNGVIRIEDSTFSGCEDLTNIFIPESVTYISTKSGLQYSGRCIYGYEGSAAQTYANEHNMSFKSASEWSGPIDLSVTTIIEPTNIYMSTPKTVFQQGESLSVSVIVLPFGAVERAYSYASSDPNIAYWDASKQCLVGKKPGKATITVTSYNNKTDALELTVLPQDYTQAEWDAILKRIDNEYKWMLFFNSFLNGGGTNPNGTETTGVNLSTLTQSTIQSAYANTLGYNAGTVESDLTKALAIFNGVMNELSTPTGQISFYQTTAVLDDVLSNVTIDKNTYNALMDVVYACNYADYFSGKDFDYAFVANMSDSVRLDLKELSIAGDAFVAIRDFLNGVELCAKYSSVTSGVNRKMALAYVEALRKCPDSTLNEAADLIEWYMDATDVERMSLMLTTNGFLPLAKKCAAKLVKKGFKLGVTGLATLMPVVGPLAVGMSTGVEIGTMINNLALNLDNIQKAAFKAQYAINFANAYRSTFTDAYTAFKNDPLNEACYENFVSSYLAYRELLGEAYDAYAEFPKAVDEAMISQLKAVITGADYSQAVTSAKGFATMARTYMDFDLGVYGDDFFPGHEITNYLIH